MDDLTAVDGIGDGNVDAIEAIGIETPAELAVADVDTVAEAKGFGESTAADVIDSAQELVDTDSSESDTEAEVTEDATPVTEDTGDEPDTTGAVDREVELGEMDAVIVPDDVSYPVDADEHGPLVELGSVPTFRNRYHVISALVGKAEQYRRRRRKNKRLAAERAIAGFLLDDSPALDEQAWDETNLAMIEEEREYRGVSRLSHITSDLRSLMNRVDEAREQFDDDSDDTRA